MTTYLLLPSVVVGPATWEPVAEQLTSAGDTAIVADPGGRTIPDDVLTAYVAAAPSAVGDLVVVPHSNAGLYAPAVAHRTGARAVVYVDAALPPAAGAAPLAPPDLLAFLTRLAGDDGLLPPWSRWWDDAEVLFPDEATRVRVEAGEPRMPLAYFRATVAAPEGWQATPSGYLAFGDTYAEERHRATVLGWPTRRLEGGHLHVLHDPAACADAVRALAAAVTDPPPLA